MDHPSCTGEVTLIGPGAPQGVKYPEFLQKEEGLLMLYKKSNATERKNFTPRFEIPGKWNSQQGSYIAYEPTMCTVLDK